MLNRKKKVVTILTVICVLITIFDIVYTYLFPFYLSHKLNMDLKDASAVGIIGGSDGPTTIYLSGKNNSNFITAILLIFTIIGISYLVINKKKSK